MQFHQAEMPVLLILPPQMNDLQLVLLSKINNNLTKALFSSLKTAIVSAECDTY